MDCRDCRCQMLLCPCPLPLPPARLSRRGGSTAAKGREGRPPGKGGRRRLLCPADRLLRVQGREIYRGSRAARSTAGPEPGNLLRVRELEITLGEFLDIDVLERHNLNVLHKTRRAVHIPHPGVLHDNLEEDLTVVGGPDV